MAETTWSTEAMERMMWWSLRLPVLAKRELDNHGPPEVKPEDVDLAVRNAVAKFFEENLMAKITPTTLTIDLLRQAGWTVRRVDHRHPFANRMVDFLGVADLLCFGKPGEGLLLVQLTADSDRRTKTGNVAKRRAKLLASDDARRWVESGGRLALYGWVRAPEGETGLVVTIEEFTAKDFAATAARED